MQKHRIGVHVEKNSFVDGGNGLILFPAGLVITDDSLQWNGTRYDIASMDISTFPGKVTTDHVDSVQTLVGKVPNTAKDGNAVRITGIQYAVDSSAMALLAYNLMRDGYLSDVSIETAGPPPDEQGVYYNAKLVGLSVVVMGNNKSARINQLVLNSIAQAKEDGLDTSDAERLVEETKPDEPAEVPKSEAPAEPEPVQPKTETPPSPKPTEVTPPPAPAPKEAEPEPLPNQENNSMSFKTVKNSRGFAVEVTFKNAAGDEKKISLADGDSVDVSEDQVETLEKQLNSAQAPQPDMSEAFKAALAEVITPLQTQLNELRDLEKQRFDKGAQEPGFEPAKNAAPKGSGTPDLDKEFAAMDYRDRHSMQISCAWDALKGNDRDAMDKLVRLNKFNLGQLKAEGIVSNSLSIGDFGNFVISQELIAGIQGIRTDYTPLITATEWKETLSTRMAWLTRSGDINMQPVEYMDDNPTSAFPNGNLKPLSPYSSGLQQADLEELAAVTPVMTAATRFLAADIVDDVAAGYRNDYDRKRAQLVIARLQQAVNVNGNSLPYSAGANITAVEDFLDVWTRIGEKTPNGTYILGTSTLSELTKRALSAGTNGPLATLFTQGPNGVSLIFGKPYIVVSDDLLPRLNTNDSLSFAVNGQSVPITQSVFYANLSNFTGRTSGGLQYDLSMEAAYEDQGVVKSAFQRNEMVLRGSFFRGGAIKDVAQVASLGSAGIS